MKNKIIVIFVILNALSLNWIKAQDVNINFSEQQQIIRGFGGINFPAWIGDLNQDMREKAFSNNPGEIGLSILRMQVPPDSTQFYREIPTAEYAKSQGATLFASPWNPPSTIREFLKETESGTDYVISPQNYPAYVDHLNNFVSYMESNVVPLYAISVQNEPDWHGWTTWTANQMLSFVRDHSQNINCRVIAPESLGYVRSTIDPLLNDSVANSHIDILGTHLYGTPHSNYYYPLAYEKNKEIWMTEHLWGSESLEINNWDMALDVATEINLCMDAQMSAFVYWYIRRFYGLITDDGNITDKGYVMSQFSKFIRPGFHRVTAEFEAVSKLTTTAYKTDSSMVIVVVNQNNNAVDLNLVLQNNDLAVETLTQFTTSETKKMVNDGAIEISGENIAVSVDGKSITTFTSNPENGARYGNQAPVAYLGEIVEFEILDTLGNGQLDFTLYGSESADHDGEIVNYSWAKDGVQISIEPDLALTFEIGTHVYVLTVTDNDGATAKSSVTINFSNDKSEEIWLEAECTQVGENWDIINDNLASNGEFLTVKTGIESTGEVSPDAANHLVYTFDVVEGGNYKIWGRVLAPNANDDSYWVKIDDGDWKMWNGIVGSSDWGWDDVHDGSNENPVVYDFAIGEHTLSVSYREDGAAIDKFYLTNTGQIPSGMGSDANNCVSDTTGFNNLYLNTNIKVYPNPVQSAFCIESQSSFYALELSDINGRTVLIKDYSIPTYTDNLVVEVGNGVYFLKLIGEDQALITRFIVNRK